MEIFGTPDPAADEADGIGRLLETTLYLSREEMLKLAEFLKYCAEDCTKHDLWDHEHFCDFVGRPDDQYPDVIVYLSR